MNDDIDPTITTMVNRIISQGSFQRLYPMRDRTLIAKHNIAARQTGIELVKEVWENDKYLVWEYVPDGNIVHLGIVSKLAKRGEPLANIPWNDKQEIKNQLCGREVEAIELFPAESRMVDTFNMYHLWCDRTPAFRFPYGWNDAPWQDN
jgi:hypothetical protein